ncbi:MAG: TonB-dependent receptor [Pseudomonadota bacterium]
MRFYPCVAATSVACALGVCMPAVDAFAQDGATAEEDTTPVDQPSDDTLSAILPPITVYATSGERQILDVPQNVTVIDRQTLQFQMPSDIQELVRFQPGIDVDRQTSGTDPFNTFGGFTIRGVGGNRVQILVDGSRVPERIIDGTRDFLDLDFTKQVEIIRGPGSVLWGSDALGGIVAFETIDPEDILGPDERIAGSAATRYDSLDNGIDTEATLAFRIAPGLEVLAGLSYDIRDEATLSNARNDGGIYGCPRNLDFGATPCGELDPTDQQAVRGLFKLVATPFDGHRFELAADVLNRNTEVDFDQTLGPTFDFFGNQTETLIRDYDRELRLRRRRFGIEHQWAADQPFLDDLQWRFSYAPQSYNREGDEFSTNADGDEIRTLDFLAYSEDFFELDIQLTSSFEVFGTTHVLTYGFDGDITRTDYERQDTTINITQDTIDVVRGGGFNFANATTRRADFFIQDQITLFDGRVELLPGLRFATYSIDPRPNADYQPVAGAEPREISDSALTAKVGAIVRLDDQFSVYGNFGQGFKMPTAQQLFTSLPGTFFNLIPAPDLRPEKVNSFELGLRGEFVDAFFSVNGFYADYDDFIQAFFNPPGTNDFTYRNLSSVQIWGIEASAEARIWRGLTASASLSWQRGVQQTSPTAETTAFDVAPLTAVLGLGYEIPEQGLQFDVIGSFAAPLQRTSQDNLFRPDGYAVFDAFASWQVVDQVELNAAVLNIFDARYFEAPFPNTFTTDPSASVARTNPIELQTAAGRTFRLGLTARF